MNIAAGTDTARETEQRIAELAKDAFARHELTAMGPGRWKCRRPDSWTYGFFVFIGPGAVIVYGDVGEGIFRATFAESEALQWLRGAVRSPDYLIGKLQGEKDAFYPGDAVQWAEEYAKQGGYSSSPIAKQKAEDFLDDVRRYADVHDLNPYSWNQLASDHGFSDVYDVGTGTASSAFWLAEALTAFVRLHDAALPKEA